MNGNRHASCMLRESHLLKQLQDLIPINGITYSLYGNHPVPGSKEAVWNSWEVVEWGYNQIKLHWKYLDFKYSMKVFEVPVSKYYIVGAFWANVRTTLYDNQIMLIFNVTQCR